ncbi:MAG: FtsX-like permease family protein [Longimicrobiales bacterium]
MCERGESPAVRGVSRQGESAVRQAIGASRSRLVRQHLTESGLLAMAGAGLGVGLAIGSIRVFEASMGGVGSMGLDARVLWIALTVGALSMLLTGLVPAVVVNKLDLTRQLKEAMPTQTGRRALLRSGFTVAQLALSLGLVVGGLLLVRTQRNLQSVELGFSPADVVEVRLDPDPRGYTDDQAHQLQREMLHQARALPMATAVAAVAGGPFQTHFGVHLRAGLSAGDDFPVESPADFVTPDYFDVLGLPLLRGRTFSADELEAGWQQSSDVAIVSELLARRLFGTTPALGRTVVQRSQSDTPLRVIGVVADSRTHNLDGPLEPMLYRPLGEYYSNDFVILVRSSAPAPVTVDALRAVVDRIDGTLPFYRAGPLSRRLDEEMGEQRFLSRLMSLLALLAALMAAVGLYGVVAFAVAEREREIGIRLALGSASSRVAWIVLRRSMMHAVCGLVFGAGLAYAAARVLESRLFGIEPLDLLTWVAAGGILLAVALIAAVVPVLRAVRVEPAQVLRT